MTVDERALELMVEARQRTLEPREAAELRERLHASPGWREDDLERAEAALWASVAAPPMPEGARRRAMSTLPPMGEADDDPLAATLRGQDPLARTLRADAPVEEDPLARTLPIAGRVSGAPSRGPAGVPTVDRAPRPAPLLRARAAAGWIAAALAAGVAVVGWWPRLSPAPASPPSPAALRASLLARPTVARLDWAPGGDPLVPRIAGEVLWDNAAQTGAMRFVGLPRNDPTQHQYQLWIFDAARDEAYPVDGGVFDVGTDGEVVVPIVAKIRVHKPTLFAVTLEKPGGVVVSRREHLLTVAKVM